MKQLKEKIYDDLFLRILQGELPHDELLKENALIEHYGVSRAPIREALLMLCVEGVLRSIPRCGYQIVLLSDKEEREIMQYRIILECGALKENFHLITPEFVERLIDADENHMANFPQPLSTFWNISISFHTLLMSVGENSYAVECLRSAMRRQYRAFAQYIWNLRTRSDMPRSDLGHSALITAIKNGNVSASVTLLEEDISNFRIYDKHFHKVKEDS